MNDLNTVLQIIGGIVTVIVVVAGGWSFFRYRSIIASVSLIADVNTELRAQLEDQRRQTDELKGQVAAMQSEVVEGLVAAIQTAVTKSIQMAIVAAIEETRHGA